MEERNKDGLTEKEFLAQYNPKDYERPSVTVDMVVIGVDSDLSNLKLLLIQRGNHPYINQWALPGGFVDIRESTYQAACRELEEETGLQEVYLEQLYTMSRPDRDPRMRVIDVAYIALMPVAKVRAGDDASEAEWFDIFYSDEELILANQEKDITIRYNLKAKNFKNGVITVTSYVPELPKQAKSFEKLAFDHAEIVLEGLMRLQNKAEYTDIAFNLVPEVFTLPDLQRVYELLLNKPLYKANFRDKIKDKVEKLDYKVPSVVGQKKSTAYRMISTVL